MKTQILWTVPERLKDVESFDFPTVLLVDCTMEPKTKLPEYNVPRNCVRVVTNAINNPNHEKLTVKFTLTSSAPLLNTLRALYPDAVVKYDLPTRTQS